jgi:hypothetical protein
MATKKTELVRLAEEMLGGLRSAANVESKDPGAVLASLGARSLDMANPERTAAFVKAAMATEVGHLAAVSPGLAALSVASRSAASLALKNPELATLAILSPDAAMMAKDSPELRAIASASPPLAILAAKAIQRSAR